jgi:hypothetical protein
MTSFCLPCQSERLEQGDYIPEWFGRITECLPEFHR